MPLRDKFKVNVKFKDKLIGERYRNKLYRYYAELNYHVQSGKDLFKRSYALERDLYDLLSQKIKKGEKAKRFVELAQLMGTVH